jgi:hypothetical protein
MRTGKKSLTSSSPQGQDDLWAAEENDARNDVDDAFSLREKSILSLEQDPFRFQAIGSPR